MSFTTKPTTGRQSAQRSNTRSRSATPPSANPAPSVLASPPLTDLPQTKGQKRGCASEDGRTGKRLQVISISGSESSQPLSKENLAKLDRETNSYPSDKMQSSATTPVSGGRKRSASRQSTVSDTNTDAASARSKNSSGRYARYRWVVLDMARIYVCPTPLPEGVQARIDAIFQRKTPEERICKVTAFARHLCEDFVGVLNSARREDESVELIYHTLWSMDHDRKFDFQRKIDWDKNLKPEIRQFYWNFDVPGISTHNANDTTNPSSMRRETDPDTNDLMPPSPSPQVPTQNNPIVKTPRPDVTVGLSRSTLADKLVARGIGGDEADLFLKSLQERRKLFSDPARQAISMCFPLLVVEGKSYSTGRVVFEAENQAAVSGSCMVNLQHQLAELTKSIVPEFQNKTEPLAFSICTQGPLMELWVHYTTSTYGPRDYNMSILKVCHASLKDGVVDFFTAVDKILRWANSEVVNDVVEQLVALERATRKPAA